MNLLPSLVDLVSNHPWLKPISDFAVIVSLFWVLDSHAGTDTMQAISRLLDPKENKDINANAAAAIRAFFNLVCALPLLFATRRRTDNEGPSPADWTPRKAWSAVLSSTFITAFATLYLTYPFFTGPSTAESTAFWTGIAVNIISNNVAVFVIRGWLFEGGGVSPWKALFGGLAAGILLVVSFTGLRLVFFFLTINHFSGLCAAFGAAVGACHPVSADGPAGSFLMKWDMALVQQMLPILSQFHLPGVLVACAVHLLLPAVAILAVVLHAANYVLRALRFFRVRVDGYMGSSHPVLAVGVFAGVVAVLAEWLVLLLP